MQAFYVIGLTKIAFFNIRPHFIHPFFTIIGFSAFFTFSRKIT